MFVPESETASLLFFWEMNRTNQWAAPWDSDTSLRQNHAGALQVDSVLAPGK